MVCECVSILIHGGEFLDGVGFEVEEEGVGGDDGVGVVLDAAEEEEVVTGEEDAALVGVEFEAQGDRVESRTW